MKIVIAGGSGFIGEPLVERLLARGDDVAVLSRDPSRIRRGRGLQWDGRTQGAWSAAVADADAVINLAGENIAGGRWTESRKKKLVDSRLDSTHAIVTALQSAPARQRVLINASAVGYYGPRGDETLDENAPAGDDFLARLVARWEAAARAAEPYARVVVLRFGIVLAREGGALRKMLLPFFLGAGGPFGSGRQWMSWVSRDDVLRLVEWALDRDAARGVYNVTAPQPVRNREFVRALGRVMRRPAVLPAPAFALRAALGEMADSALLSGQKALPARAEAEGFTFVSIDVEQALRHALSTPRVTEKRT